MLISHGFYDIEENLRRLKKFKHDHVRSVMKDYEANPVKEEAPAKQSNGAKVMPA